MFLIMIIISILLVTWWIKMADRYAYSDISGKKTKIPNALKIVLYTVCLIPILNVAFTIILLTGISFIEFEWKGWEENKILYWLFKK